jgi:hypothetical protein
VGKAVMKGSHITGKIASIMDKHYPSCEETRVLKEIGLSSSALSSVVADLRRSDCLSVEECTTVFENYSWWKSKLVEKAAEKESDIVEKVASIMDKHFPSSEKTRVLKVVADLRGSDCLSVEECTSVFKNYYHMWKWRLVGKAAVKEIDIIEKIASILYKHLPSSDETKALKVGMELKTSNFLSMEDFASVFQHHHMWRHYIVEIAVLKELQVLDGIANLLDKHWASDIPVKVLKGN